VPKVFFNRQNEDKARKRPRALDHNSSPMDMLILCEKTQALARAGRGQVLAFLFTGSLGQIGSFGT
jgi:hypothetical protein